MSPSVFLECNETKEEEEENNEEEELADALGGLNFFTEEEMNIDTFFQPCVRLRGQCTTARHRGLLMITVDLPPGSVLQSIAIHIDPQDPNKGFVHVDISPSFSLPDTHISQAWIDPVEGNPILAEMLCDQVQSRFERDALPGFMSLYQH
jgi:hypothetical protein